MTVYYVSASDTKHLKPWEMSVQGRWSLELVDREKGEGCMVMCRSHHWSKFNILKSAYSPFLPHHSLWSWRGKVLILPAHGKLCQSTGMEQIIEENLCVILLKVFLVERFSILPHLLWGRTYVSISEVHNSPSYESLSRIIKVKGLKKSLYVVHQRESIDLNIC